MFFSIQRRHHLTTNLKSFLKGTSLFSITLSVTVL